MIQEHRGSAARQQRYEYEDDERDHRDDDEQERSERAQYEYEYEHDADENQRSSSTGQRTHRRRDSRSVADLVRDLRDEATLLARQQVELAKAEMTEKFSKWARNAAYIAVGGFIAYAGFLFLLLAATFGVLFGLIEGGMADVHALWVAPLLVGVVVAVVGYIFVQKGISTLKRASAIPQRTRRTLREDKQWLEQKTR